jgi:hypothetical protein
MTPKNFLGTQLLGSAKTYNLQQEILGTVAMPKSTDALDKTQDAVKKLLLARNMNDTAMCLFNLSMTDKVSTMTLYNGKTTELPDGDAAKGKNRFKIILCQEHKQDE